MTKRGWLAVAAAAAIVVAISAWFANRVLNPEPIEIARGDVSAIALQPVPEGPILQFTSSPLHGSWTATDMPLSSVAQFIPVPLPGTDFQGTCQTGGDLVLSLRNGRQVTYGPCRHPSSIRALWRQMELLASGGQCQEPCAPDH